MSMTNDLIDPLKPSGLYISILAAQNLVAGALLMQRLLDLCDTPWNRDLPIYARPARSPALPLMAKYGFTPVHLRPGNDPAVYKRTNIQ